MTRDEFAAREIWRFTVNTKTDSIWAAAEHLLRRDAEELRESSTSPRDRDDWTGEEEAKGDYDEHIAAADALASLSTVAAALPPSYLGGSLVANGATGECVVRMHFGDAQEAERWFDVATDSSEAAPKAAPQPAAQQGELIGWIKSSEIDSAKRMGGSINLWLNKYDCDTPLYTHPAAPAAQGDALDAARYRWLRDVGDATWVPFRIRTGYSAAQVDAAIDAARSQAKEGAPE